MKKSPYNFFVMGLEGPDIKGGFEIRRGNMELNQEQKERYNRHIILPEVGLEGQEKLLEGKVLLVGLGGLGSSAGLYLAAAGIGTVGVVDGDCVSLCNLQRQVIHETRDIGSPKVESARKRMLSVNPGININVYREMLTVENAVSLIKDYDFIIDATDNFSSKFLIADACHFSKKPYSHAGIFKNEGQLMTVIPGETACYRCVFHKPPPVGFVASSSDTGILGFLPGVIGTLQAAEAVKYLLDIGELLTDCLMVYNVIKTSFRRVPVKQNKDCPLCSESPSIVDLKENHA
ncbi:MAG: HesA/MoeB/ThiF family protein [Candidatus Theseobacter exili]|nr:HesA/MoeB/ThiF family protein [Candidatus Theseobacter exili]